MSSVSLSSGAGIDRGGTRNTFYFQGKRVPKNRSEATKFLRRQRQLWQCAVLPVILGILFSLPVSCTAGKTKKDTESTAVGNFSQSPTNHEEVSTTGGDSDFWVGSNKLEFKPHPLLMPSTQMPAAQIPMPIIELGTPPTATPSSSSEGGEVDDLSESASTSEEERAPEKPKTPKNRGGQKKSRDQRRMAHRTLWARQNAASNFTANNAYTTALHHNPYFLHNQMGNQQQSPMIITGGGMMGHPQNPLLMSPFNSRTDDNFHGSAATWSINPPGNGIIAPNLVPGYFPSRGHGLVSPSQQHKPGAGTNPNDSPVTAAPSPQFPLGAGGLPAYPYGYSPFQQQQVMSGQFAQYAPAPAAQNMPQQVSVQAPALSQGQYPFTPSGPEYLSQQSGATPIIVGGSNGPMLMYMSPGGAPVQAGIGGPAPSASSSPITATKPFNFNEIPGLGYPPHLQYNSITGPDFSGGSQQHHHQHSGSSSGGSTNPQYFRNNFLRMIMDRMANMGRLLPIPFVTKYASPATPTSAQTPQQLQGYSRHTNYNRRMK